VAKEEGGYPIVILVRHDEWEIVMTFYGIAGWVTQSETIDVEERR
jgi:hypothetical protein